MKIKIVKNLDEKKKRKKRRKKSKPRATYWWGYGLHDQDYGDAGDGGGGDGKRDDELSEVYSDKQRRYMCAMTEPDADRPKGLSKKEAEEMCSGPMKEEWSEKERKNRKDKCSNPKGFTMKQFCKNQKTKSKKGEKKNE